MQAELESLHGFVAPQYSKLERLDEEIIETLKEQMPFELSEIPGWFISNDVIPCKSFATKSPSTCQAQARPVDFFTGEDDALPVMTTW